MGKSFKLEVRMGNVFKINRVIRGMVDANNAIVDINRKLSASTSKLVSKLAWNIAGIRQAGPVGNTDFNQATLERLVGDIRIHMANLGMIAVSEKKPVVDNVIHLSDKAEGEKHEMEYFDCVIESESDVLFHTAGEIKTLCGLLIDSINFQMCERGLAGEIGNPIHSAVCMITQRADEIQESIDNIGLVITGFLSELKEAA
jgi:hypothetical protein